VIALITVILSFILSGIIGNRLVQRWQQRNWRVQHGLEATEKNLEALREIADDITKFADARIFRARRVVWQIARPRTEAFDRIQREYEESVAAWNDRFTSFCVSLTMFATHRLSGRLEETIQSALVRTSDEIDEAIRKGAVFSATQVRQLHAKLDGISGLIWQFSRDLVRYLMNKRDEAYNGRMLTFCPTNFQLFSTWYLIKALFKTRQELDPISSTALDADSPFFSRSEWTWVYEHRS
jgi:hypothetical protein